MEALKLLIAYLASAVRDHARRARQTATVGSFSAEMVVLVVFLVGLAIGVAALIGAWAYGKLGELGS